MIEAATAVKTVGHTGSVSGKGVLCALQYAAGRIEACPGPACPFWEEGGAVVEPGCAIERLGLRVEGNPQLAGWLLRIRTALCEAAAPAEREQALHLFHRLLPPGLRD